MPITHDKDEDPTIHQSRRVENPPTRLQSTHDTASSSQYAVYSVLGNAFLADVPHTVPKSLQDSKLSFCPPMDTEEVVNGVVYLVTKEKITKYKKLVEEPLFAVIG